MASLQARRPPNWRSCWESLSCVTSIRSPMEAQMSWRHTLGDASCLHALDYNETFQERVVGSAQGVKGNSIYCRCKAEQLIMVGDRYLTDVVYGNQNGMFTIRPAPLTLTGEPSMVRMVGTLPPPCSFSDYLIRLQICMSEAVYSGPQD